ncbi:MAG: ABC transporter permease [Chloroflexi bacterium]|nr:ABC transporter permease [Chloroflexota bacterium]
MVTATVNNGKLTASEVAVLTADQAAGIGGDRCPAGLTGGAAPGSVEVCGAVSLIGDHSGERIAVVGGQTYFDQLIVGCRKPIEREVQQSNGTSRIETVGCNDYVTLRSLETRRTSNGVLFGDFGLSWQILRDRPVSLLIMSRLWRTLQLMSSSLIISLLLGVPLGVYSAVRQYSRFDYAFTTLSFIGSSMPTFFMGILMILFFGLFLHNIGWPYLPVGNAVGVKDYVIPVLGAIKAGSLRDNLLRAIMPTAVLVLFTVAGWSRYVRSSMLEVLRQDYVRTARAKGLLERLVILKHALRNALIPFSTILMLSIPGLFSGAIITETVFNWPGMGRLYFDALGRTDWPVAMALLFITAELTVAATLVSDLLYTFIDPRIRFS